MSLVASQARLIMLTRYVSDLEYGKGMISQEQMVLANKAQECSDDTEAVSYFHTQSKELEAEIKSIQLQLDAGTTELESLKNMVKDDVKRDFAYA